MIAVADTSPLCYLVLIDEADLLRQLFSQVVVPSAVIMELLHEDAPEAVRGWAANLPKWVSLQENPVRNTAGLEILQVGEQGCDSVGGVDHGRVDPARRKISAPYRRSTRHADHGHAGCLG